VKCLRCGASNKSNNKFCVKCGSELFVNACTNESCANLNSGQLASTDLYCPLCGTGTTYQILRQFDQDVKEEEARIESENDPLLYTAIEMVVDAQMASTTMLQKKLKLGYARASRILDQLEAEGIVGPPEGSTPRKVFMSVEQWKTHTTK